MDFAKFDARTAAETPRPCPLVHPVTGEPILDDGKPCCVLVRGASSREVQDLIRKAARDEVKAKATATTLEDLQTKTIAAAARLIVGFQNITRNGVPAKAPDDVAWFLDLTMVSVKTDEDGNIFRPSFAQQVVKFGTDDANFLGNGSHG